MSLIRGKTGDWEAVIGLEVHAQVTSCSKLFSGAATRFGARPNAQVSPVDAAMPGMLPVLNRHCVAQAVRTGLGLNAKINLHSVFERKNYFYPDLPPGYQISQYLEPIVGAGVVVLDLPDGTTREVGIERLHLEQDAGRSLHDQHPSRTYVDFNRAGVALMEIVSAPDLRSAEEAALYMAKLRSILRYLGTCDGNMEEGSLRCDVNLSVRRPGAALGTRSETKNVNSIRFIRQAIEYEGKRQVAVLEDGGKVVQETRLFDAEKGVTRAMRSKEEAHDYRYFPDPDLLPLELDPDWVEELRRGLPELPDAKRKRFVSNFGLAAYPAGILVAEKDVADAAERFFRKDLQRLFGPDRFREIEPLLTDDSAKIRERPDFESISASSASSANIIITQVFSYSNEHNIDAAELIDRLDLVGLREHLDNDVISGRMAKEVFIEMAKTGKTVVEIVQEKGLEQISDAGALEAVVARIVAEHPEQAAQYKAGNEKVLGWFVGQVMKATKGKANPGLVNRILKDRLG